MTKQAAILRGSNAPAALRAVLPKHDGLYYGGEWHQPKLGGYFQTHSPSTGELLGRAASATAEDVDSAVAAAQSGFEIWRRVAPMERARILREGATIMRAHAEELATLDAHDGGNPITEMMADIRYGAAGFDFFAGLVTEMKGASVPMGPDAVNFSVREPWGVVVRILAFNHPLLFTAIKAAAPLAAGNVVITKPPEQAPLSNLRLAELFDGLFPPGVFNLLTGGPQLGQALTTHPGVAMLSLVGSVPTGRAVARAAAERLRPVSLELGGKNALIAFPDTDPEEVANAVVQGMNFTWCGQSCGSTSRAFIHEDIYDAVLRGIERRVGAYRPGLPDDPGTTMGALVSPKHLERVLGYVESGKAEGARLLCGGKRPDDPKLAAGCFLEPTVFADVTQSMRIAREEIFGPVLCVLRWSDYRRMLEDVNSVEYGLTASIWTNDLYTAHNTAAEVQSGFVWINEVSKHFLGAPFGGYKQSGLGREESLEELYLFTQQKNIHVNLRNTRGQGKRLNTLTDRTDG